MNRRDLLQSLGASAAAVALGAELSPEDCASLHPKLSPETITYARGFVVTELDYETGPVDWKAGYCYITNPPGHEPRWYPVSLQEPLTPTEIRYMENIKW